jgi:hypothetical protein
MMRFLLAACFDGDGWEIVAWSILLIKKISRATSGEEEKDVNNIFKRWDEED